MSSDVQYPLRTNGNQKRLLVCCPGIPQRSEGASTVLFQCYIDGLIHAGFRVLNILLLQPGQYSEPALAEYKSRMEAATDVEVFVCSAEKFIQMGRFTIRLNQSAAKEIQQRAHEFAPDVIFCLDLLSAWLFDGFDFVPKVVWLGDLNFQTHFYHAWYATVENLRNFPGIPLVWVQSRIWKRIYRDVLRKVESVIVSSDSSRHQLSRIGIKARYEPYPWPSSRTSSAPAQLEPGLPPFLFFGNLVGLGSRSAFHFMTDSLYPRLKAAWGSNGFQIFICGLQGLPDWVKSALADKPELKYLGFVDDLDALMKQCRAVLVPIDVPVGNRSRILTALAKGTLVIAHRNAALGNPSLIDGETCYLAHNAEEFLDRMKRACNSEAEVKRIVEKAGKVYNSEFRPDVANGKMVDEIKRVLQTAK